MAEIQLLEKALFSQQNGNLEEAEIFYKKVLEINPENDNALYFLGMIFYQSQQIDKAKEFFLKAIQLNPIANYYLTMGDLCNEFGQTIEGSGYYMEAVRLEPNNPELLAVTADSLLNIRKFGAAIEFYNDLLLLEPENLEANYNSAIAYKYKNDYNNSVKYLNKCIELKPDFIEALEQLGEIFAIAQNYQVSYDYYNAELDIKLARTNVADTCRVCGSESKHLHDGVLLCKYSIKYYYCKNCGFLHTEKPYWLEEAYQESINVYDTGIMARNLDMSVRSAVIIYFLFNKNTRFLDYAGGYGIFTR